MDEKYFLHRIQEENGAFSKGIEIHDTKESAIRSFWGRMKLGYNNPQNPTMTFVSCKITDTAGNTVAPYDMTWRKNPNEATNTFFMHQIRKDGNDFSKGIDVCGTFNEACRTFAAAMEYGYDNPQHTGVTFVSCEITDRSGVVMVPFAETWVKTEVEPAPEPEPEPEEA